MASRRCLAKNDLLKEPIKRCLKDGERIRSHRNQSVKGIKNYWADESDEMDWDLFSEGDLRGMLLVSDRYNRRACREFLGLQDFDGNALMRKVRSFQGVPINIIGYLDTYSPNPERHVFIRRSTGSVTGERRQSL